MKQCKVNSAKCTVTMARWNRLTVPPADASCTSCGENMAAAAPRCEECKRYTHVRCTEIPMYQLVHYFSSRVAYFCQECMEQKYEDYNETSKKIEECMSSSGKDVETAAVLSGTMLSDTEDNSAEPSAPPASQVLTQVTERAAPPTLQAATLPVNDVRNAPSVGVEGSRTQAKVCRYYKKGSCKFGRRGVGCNFKHPQICVKFQRNGENINGCKKGNKCDRFHRHTCKYTIDGKHCGDEKCKRLHVRNSEGRREHPRSTPGRYQRGESKSHTEPLREWRFRESVETGPGRVEEARMQVVNTAAHTETFLEVKEEIKWMKEKIKRMLNLMDWTTRGQDMEKRVSTLPVKYSGDEGRGQMEIPRSNHLYRSGAMMGWGTA